jgi:hypothetical protein
MFLILLIDFVVVVVLVTVYKRKGLEAVLPYFVFIITLVPDECRINLNGLFDLYTRRLALVVLAILFFTASRKGPIRAFPLKHLMILHFGWAIASTAVSIVVTTSAKLMLAQVLEYYLLYYILLKSVSSVRTISKIAFAMVAAMTVCCIFGLLEIYAQWSVLSIFPAELQLGYGNIYSELFDRGIRARSTFPHPIHFGGALAMVIPLAFYLVTSKPKGWFAKVFLNVSLLLMFWNLYKTSSRGPWIAAIFAMVILTLAAESKIRNRIAMVAVLAGAVLVIRPGVAETLVNMFQATFDPASRMGSSFQYRPILFDTVSRTLNENPIRAIFGFGLGSFREKGLVLEMPGIEAHRWYTCDSSFILFWYETGYFGLLILTILLVRPALMAVRSFRTLPKSDRYFSLVLLSSMAAFYVVMITVASYGWGQNGLMLWAVIAMSVAYTILKKDELRRSRVARVEGPVFVEGARPVERTISLGEAIAGGEAEQLSNPRLAGGPLRAGTPGGEYSTCKFYD